MDISRRQMLETGVIGLGATLCPDFLAAEALPFDSRFPTGIMSASTNESSGVFRVLSGELPVDLFGHVFLMEGIPLEQNHFTPAAKGAITRIDFGSDGTVRFLRKMIKTPEVIMQDNLGTGVDQFRLLGGLVYLSPTLGFMNYCNTVPLPMGDNRFCLGFEGGIPHEFNAETLEVVTPIGTPSEWVTSLPAFAAGLTPKRWLFEQVRGTAHAYFDLRTGECFMHNFGGNLGGVGKGFLRLIKWDQKGRLDSRTVRARDGKAAALIGTGHSLGVTRNYVVIFDTATRVEGQRTLGVRTIEPQTDRMRIWVIRRDELAKKRDWVTADSIVLDFDTSDIMVDYDDFDDVITMYGQYLSAADKSEPMYAREELYFGGRVRAEHSGYPIAPVDVGGIVRAAVQVTAKGLREVAELFHVTRDSNLTWDMNDPAHRDQYQFPDRFEHIYWAAIGYRPEHLVKRATDAYRDYPDRVYSNASLPRTPVGSAILHQDCASMAIVDSFQFPLHMIMRTPIFLRKKGDEGADASHGYIACAVAVNTAFEPTPSHNGKEIWIFDAQNLKQGPLCRLHHPDFEFATTNHGLWVEGIGSRPKDAYRANLQAFYEQRLAYQSPTVVSLVKKEVFSRFL